MHVIFSTFRLRSIERDMSQQTSAAAPIRAAKQVFTKFREFCAEIDRSPRTISRIVLGGTYRLDSLERRIDRFAADIERLEHFMDTHPRESACALDSGETSIPQAQQEHGGTSAAA